MAKNEYCIKCGLQLFRGAPWWRKRRFGLCDHCITPTAQHEVPWEYQFEDAEDAILARQEAWMD